MPWYSGFLSQSEDMHVKLTGSKLEIEVNLSVNGCLSHCVSSEIEWRPAQGLLYLLDLPYHHPPSQ